MKPNILLAGAALVASASFAGEPVASARTDASATSADAAKVAQARREMAELREEMQRLSSKMARLSSDIGEDSPRAYAYRYIGDPDRAMIGVVLGTSDGHVIMGALTPDGPAYRAGLRTHDIVTAIDHQSIAADSTLASHAKAQKLLSNLKEGQKVTIDYVRDGQKHSVTVAAERREPVNWPRMFSSDPEHPFLPKDFDVRVRAEVARAESQAERAFARSGEARAEVARARAEARAAVKESRRSGAFGFVMPWWGLNLAALNPDLGRYFGADRGVLVLSTDETSMPGLRAGDVIRSIAGESVARPEDALRALRDRDPGSKVPIDVLREHKTLALEMKAPEFNSIFNLREVPPVPPAPEAPAAPAPAPAPAAVPAPPSPPAPTLADGQ